MAAFVTTVENLNELNVAILRLWTINGFTHDLEFITLVHVHAHD